VSRIRDPRNRIRLAWTLLIFSVVGWPTSALTLASDEPQFILALSWLAITLTALNILATTDVRRRQENE
jgi:uncharacterized membrane protein YfcA